jgi:diacylglycerol kinase (ATP)
MSTTSGDIPVILNPAARSARAGGQVKRVRALSERIRLCPTQGPGDARRLARELATSGASIVVAAGGDGTINEVVNGLAEAAEAGHTATLGLLPSGTMNVFANELGLPAESLTECWQAIEQGHTMQIDLWQIAGHRFAQLAGVGFDAAVIEATTWRRKKRFGPLSYIISAIQVVRQSTPHFTVRCPGRPDLPATQVLIGNGALYGGPFQFFPDARFDDGRLDVLVFNQGGWRLILHCAKAAFFGAHENGWAMSRFQTSEIEIIAPDDILSEVDGEVCHRGSCHVTRDPRGLWVCVPKP